MNFSTTSKLSVDELVANAKKVYEELKKYEPFVAEIRVNDKALKVFQRYASPSDVPQSLFPAFQGTPLVACLQESSESIVKLVWRFRLEEKDEQSH